MVLVGFNIIVRFFLAKSFIQTEWNAIWMENICEALLVIDIML